MSCLYWVILEERLSVRVLASAVEVMFMKTEKMSVKNISP